MVDINLDGFKRRLKEKRPVTDYLSQLLYNFCVSEAVYFWLPGNKEQ